MLVLTRHVATPANHSEHVILRTASDEVIRIYFLGYTSNGATKLGFDAPESVNIIRSELERNQIGGCDD